MSHACTINLVGVASPVLKILLIVTLPNNTMGRKGKLTNKLASQDKYDSNLMHVRHTCMCVYMKCGHNINLKISQIHTNTRTY